MYSSFGVSLIIDAKTDSLYYDGSLSYVDKIDIGGIVTKPQNLQANIMYNAAHLYSLESQLLAVTDV